MLAVNSAVHATRAWRREYEQSAMPSPMQSEVQVSRLVIRIGCACEEEEYQRKEEHDEGEYEESASHCWR